MKKVVSVVAVLVGSILLTSVFGTVPAIADDESDAQAVVTAALTAQQVQSPGVFSSVTFIENYPYAYMAAGLGLTGKGSMNFALEKVNGTWIILGQGGGFLGRSEMIAFGIPEANATNLQGFACTAEPRRGGGGDVSRPAVIRERASQSRTVLPYGIMQLVRARGVGALPSKNMVAAYRGHLTNVTVYQPLAVYRCAL